VFSFFFNAIAFELHEMYMYKESGDNFSPPFKA
jgi:hypothetical protein